MTLSLRRPLAGLLALVLGVPVVAGLVAAAPAPATAGGPPAGFTEQIVMTGLTNPTKLVFAPDGRVLVAQKNGIIKIFDSLSDTTPTTLADLRTNVYSYGDFGILGMAVPPDFPANPYVYVAYTYDGVIGGSAPTYNDKCPSLGDCLVSNRVSRLRVAGDVMTGNEQVLLHDWCTQYETHAIGDVAFGPDGKLYVSGGDGASPSFPDWGQRGTVTNACGDPGAPIGGAMTPPTAEGGALRSQDVRTPGDPTGLNGTFIRVDPVTGAAPPDNPMADSADPNTRRILAYGLRNPYKWTFRPGTEEVWFGDVGWRLWEEINRLADPLDGPVENFGWPCYEADIKQNGYNSPDLDLCESLYAEGPSAVVAPQFAYHHANAVVAGDGCPTGGSSPSALAFYPPSGGSYPSTYNGALFWGDYARQCIWAMLPGAGGVPDRDHVVAFTSAAATPVDMQIGPDKRLYYVDHGGGTIRRFDYDSANQPPVAAATATPSAGNAPLTVAFDASASTDGDPGEVLSYQWDFTDDGTWDASGVTASHTYTTTGTYRARLRVSDLAGASSEKTLQILVGTGAPTAVIDTPAADLSFKVGDTVTFSGHATDPQDGTLPAANLSWRVTLEHCYAADNCHTHAVEDWEGVASGSFVAPDHEYPSYLNLELTATDSGGLTHTTVRRLDPRAVELAFHSNPPGLQLSVNGTMVTTPATQTVLVGSTNTISAPTQSGYSFSSWSDGGAATHVITAPESPRTYTATYTGSGGGDDGYEMDVATGQPYVAAGGTTLPLAGDDDKTKVSLPFAFPFFGAPQSSAWITTNGFISFADPGNAGLIAENTPLPNGNAPNAAIYPFWDDLVLRADSAVRTEATGTAPNRRFVVEWDNVGHYGSSSARLSVSAVLHESGRIDFTYANLNTAREYGNSATVGIENVAGSAALTYSFNEAKLANGKRITFTPSGGAGPVEPEEPTTGTLRGTVTNAGTGQPIAGATVTLTPGGASATTAANGSYQFGAVAPGTYGVAGAAAGGLSASKTATVSAGNTTTVNLALSSGTPPPTGGYTKTTEQREYVPATGGTVLALTGDDAVEQISLPFPVPFYGQNRSTAWVSTNGFLSFADPVGAQPENVAIPATAVPNAGVYPFWDDLVMRADSEIRTKVVGSAPNRQMVVEWHNIGQYGSSSARVTFQVALHENGDIVFNYRDLAATKTREKGDSATVGLENPLGTAAVQHSYNTPALADNQAIRFEPN